MSNTLPLAILAGLALYAYPRATRFALPFIWIFSGLGVWLFARPSTHVGISGIVHGLMFFLFVLGVLRRDRLGIAIALMVFFLYGGMVLTVLPRDPQISFEYHLFGAIAGLIAAIALFRARSAAAAQALQLGRRGRIARTVDRTKRFLRAPPRSTARIIAFPVRDNDKPTLH